MANKETTVISLQGDVTVKTDKATKDVQTLKDLINSLVDKKIELTIGTKSAHGSLSALQNRITGIFKLEPELKIKTDAAEKKIDNLRTSLETKLNSNQNAVKLLINTDSARGKIRTVQNNINKIFDQTYKLKVDTSEAI